MSENIILIFLEKIRSNSLGNINLIKTKDLQKTKQHSYIKTLHVSILKIFIFALKLKKNNIFPRE